MTNFDPNDCPIGKAVLDHIQEIKSDVKDIRETMYRTGNGWLGRLNRVETRLKIQWWLIALLVGAVVGKLFL